MDNSLQSHAQKYTYTLEQCICSLPLVFKLNFVRQLTIFKIYIEVPKVKQKTWNFRIYFELSNYDLNLFCDKFSTTVLLLLFRIIYEFFLYFGRINYQSNRNDIKSLHCLILSYVFKINVRFEIIIKNLTQSQVFSYNQFQIFNCFHFS